MAPVSLPPGFRFHPSDEELLSYYLKRKVHGRKIELDIIPEVDLYKCEPWDLPNKSFLPNRDLEWYFFSPRDRKYPNGSRTNRATEAGYWKATGKDRKIVSQLVMMGMKKTLVFYTGRAPQGRRTGWVMHEYRLDEMQCDGASGLQDAFVLCRVFKKSGTEQKNGEQNGTHSEKNILSSLMNNSFSENMTSFGTVQELPERSYSQIRQEEGGIQANLILSSEASSKMSNDRNDCNSPSNWLLESELDDANQNRIFRFPDNLKNGLKVNSTFEGVRFEKEFAHPMLKAEDFPQCLDDVGLNMAGAPNESPGKLRETFEEAILLEEILKVAQESQDRNAGYLFAESPLENHIPSKGDNYESSAMKELDRTLFGEIYEFEECSQNSTWNGWQEILPCQGQAELRDTGSTVLQREMINMCRWQCQFPQTFLNSFDYSKMDGCSCIPELYS